MVGLLCYSLLESCYLVVPSDVSFISPATILLLSLSCTDVASNSIPRTFAHWTGLAWLGLPEWSFCKWPMGILRMKAETGFGKVWSCLPVLANWNGTLSFLSPSLHPCISDSKINRRTNLLINSSFCLYLFVSKQTRLWSSAWSVYHVCIRCFVVMWTWG